MSLFVCKYDGIFSLMWIESGTVTRVCCYTSFVHYLCFHVFWNLQAVHFITFYAPLWGAILFNGITYFQVIRMLNNATRVSNCTDMSCSVHLLDICFRIDVIVIVPDGSCHV